VCVYVCASDAQLEWAWMWVATALNEMLLQCRLSRAVQKSRGFSYLSTSRKIDTTWMISRWKSDLGRCKWNKGTPHPTGEEMWVAPQPRIFDDSGVEFRRPPPG
jgi:hypothetical protein